MISRIVLLALTSFFCFSDTLEASCGCCWSSSSGNSEVPKKLSKKEMAELKAQGGVVYDEYGEAWHSIRYQKEFTAAQWKTILLQKRIRVPLTAEDQRALESLFVGDL